MLLFIIANVHEDIIQRCELGPTSTEVTILILVLDRAKQVKKKWIVINIIFLSNGRHRFFLEFITVVVKLPRVCIICMVLNQLGKVICNRRREKVD
jgi:hypothetical protein